MQSVVRLFLAGVSPKRMDFILFREDESSQAALLNETVLRADGSTFSLSRKYKMAFLKEFIEQMEQYSADVTDVWYETLASLMKETDYQESFFKIYLLNNGSVVRVRENASALSQGSTGLSHWQATYFLSQYVEENRHRFHKKNIVELGCGLGLLGLTIVQLSQPTSYVFTDYNASVLRMLCENIVSTFDLDERQKEDLLNGVEIAVNNGASLISIKELDWSYWCSENDESFSSGLDIVLAADVAYDPASVPDFCRILETLLRSRTNSNQVQAYVAHTIRHEDTYTLLQSELAKRNCEIGTPESLTMPGEIDKRALPNWSPNTFPCVLLRIV